MFVRLFLLGCTVSLCGCLHGDVPEQNFPDAWAASWCNRYAECDRAGFESAYGTGASCRADKSGDINFQSEWKDLLCGDYDASAAGECLDTIDTLQCDDWASDEWRNECARVYGC